MEQLARGVEILSVVRAGRRAYLGIPGCCNSTRTGSCRGKCRRRRTQQIPRLIRSRSTPPGRRTSRSPDGGSDRKVDPCGRCGGAFLHGRATVFLVDSSASSSSRDSGEFEELHGSGGSSDHPAQRRLFHDGTRIPIRLWRPCGAVRVALGRASRRLARGRRPVLRWSPVHRSARCYPTGRRST
jgi:hypothetical protein